MAWVRFSRRFRWRVPELVGVVRTFPADRACCVTRRCAEAACAAGAGVVIPTPARGVDPNEV